MTCGGAFDAEARRYAENVIVWAVPVDAARAVPVDAPEDPTRS